MRIDLTTNASEDDVQGKRTLFIKYVQSLPCWLEARTFDQQSLALVCELLAGIREVTQVNSYFHQNLFRCVAPGLQFLYQCLWACKF